MVELAVCGVVGFCLVAGGGVLGIVPTLILVLL